MDVLYIKKFGFTLAIALAAFVLMTLICSKRRKHVFGASAAAALSGFVFARFVYCGTNFDSYILAHQADILKLWNGGYSLWGGLFGAVLGVAVYCRRHRILTGEMLDSMAPGLSLFVLIERVAESITEQGVGKAVMNEQLRQMSLFTLNDQWGDARFNVRLYEAIVAAAVLLIALIAQGERKHRRQGEAFTLSAAVLSAFQIVLESLRDDAYIHITFVRISQCLAAIVLFILLFRYFRSVKTTAKSLVPFLMVFAGVGLATYEEFKVDSVENNMELHYLFMLAGAMMMLIGVLVLRRAYLRAYGHRKTRKSTRAKPFGAIVLLLVMAGAFGVFIISGANTDAKDVRDTMNMFPAPVADETEEPAEETHADNTDIAQTPVTDTACADTTTPDERTETVCEVLPAETASFDEAEAASEPVIADGNDTISEDTPEEAENAEAIPAEKPDPEKIAAQPLPMNSFEGGCVLDGSGLKDNSYEDGTISVKYSRERYTYKSGKATYNSYVNIAEVTIQSPCQLRTAIAGSVTSARTALVSKMAASLNAVVAVNGDYYSNRAARTFEVRQGQRISDSTADGMDVLIIDYDGNFHIFKSDEAAAAYEAMQGNIYQCFTFGPALVVDGELAYTENVAGAFPYFGAWANNPRTAIGQIDELHYLLVMVEGRTRQSCGIPCKELAELMLEKGCKQAFNLDGGATSVMYFGTKRVSEVPDTGLRNVSDMIYFVSAEE